MLVTRARVKSSKNNTLLMCRIWKMGRNLFSSLDIRDNFKVAYLEKNSNNPKIYLVTITVWHTGSVINWVNLSCWLLDVKVDIWQNLPKNATFKLLAMSKDEPKFFFYFCILYIKNVWILLKLEMALVTTIEMKFALVCILSKRLFILSNIMEFSVSLNYFAKAKLWTSVKVEVFREGHKNLKNLPLSFVVAH